MDRDKAIAEWVRLKRERDAIEERMKELEDQLMPMVDVGETLTAKTGEVIVKRDRGVLDPARLEASVSVGIWRSITRRTPVAALIKAQVIKGKLSQNLVDACYNRSKPWFSIKQ